MTNNHMVLMGFTNPQIFHLHPEQIHKSFQAGQGHQELKKKSRFQITERM